jgi:putative flippase GtrA
VSPSAERTRREVTRFLKFSVVGAIGAVVDFGTFNLLSTVLGLWSVAASILSFSAAVTSNFLWNRNWVYPDSRAKPVAAQAAQFALVNVVGLLIRTPVFALGEAPMARLAASLWPRLQSLPAPVSGLASWLNPAVAGSNLALALAVIIVLFWNFGVNRLWTYSDAT